MNLIKKCLAILILASIFLLSSCEYLPFLSDNEQSGWQDSQQGEEIVNGNHPDWDFYPAGYTGGFSLQPGNKVEFWWVETYEECLAAIELLKSHGSTFAESVIFTYEGDLFDTKYCFKISLNNRYTEEIKFGDNPFDRKGWNISVCSYAFFEDVTIDEINHSYVNEYKFSSLSVRYLDDMEDPELSLENSYLKWNAQYNRFEVIDSETKADLIRMGSFRYKEDSENAYNCAEAVFNSLVLIGFDD